MIVGDEIVLRVQHGNAPSEEPVDGILILKEAVGRNLRVIGEQLLADILRSPAREIHQHDPGVKIRVLRLYAQIGLDLVVYARLLRHGEELPAEL